MMNRIRQTGAMVLFLLLLVSFPMRGQEPVYKEGFYPDGKLRYKGYFIDKEPVGEITHYYPGGNVKALMKHEGEHVDAILYSQDGELFTYGKYRNRQKTGTWEYRSKQRLFMTEVYKDNKQEGLSVSYNFAGDTLEVKNWKAGVLSGRRVLFYNNHNKRFEATYMAGKLAGELISYHYDGKIAVKGQYKNDQKEGTWYYYSPDGEIEKVVRYINGISENREEDERQENQEIDRIISEGRKIPDPADFANNPEIYMRFSE